MVNTVWSRLDELRTLALFPKSGDDSLTAECNAQLFFGVLHRVTTVILAHVHGLVAQLLYLRYGARVHARIVVELHVKFEADAQFDVVADEVRLRAQQRLQFLRCRGGRKTPSSCSARRAPRLRLSASRSLRQAWRRCVIGAFERDRQTDRERERSAFERLLFFTRSRWGHTTSSHPLSRLQYIHQLPGYQGPPISARFGGRPEYSAQNDASRGTQNVSATVAHWCRIAR